MGHNAGHSSHYSLAMSFKKACGLKKKLEINDLFFYLTMKHQQKASKGLQNNFKSCFFNLKHLKISKTKTIHFMPFKSLFAKS